MVVKQERHPKLCSVMDSRTTVLVYHLISEVSNPFPESERFLGLQETSRQVCPPALLEQDLAPLAYSN